jgi:replication factor C subunit 1
MLEVTPLLASLSCGCCEHCQTEQMHTHASIPPPAAGSSSGAAGSSGGSGATELWVDKHKPRDSNDLVGNPGLIKTLRGWLQQWEAIHLYGAEPQPIPGAGAGKPKDLGKKAVLLSGPPGIGKTSSAHIVAK